MRDTLYLKHRGIDSQISYKFHGYGKQLISVYGSKEFHVDIMLIPQVSKRTQFNREILLVCMHAYSTLPGILRLHS